MPDLVTCSDDELQAILPGIARLASLKDTRSLVDQKALRSYEKAMRKQVERGIIPGFCSLVLWGGSVLHADAHGFADLESKVKFRTDTLVRLYCMGKSVVAVGLMLLVDRGCCALEDDVAKYIPAFGSKHRVLASTGKAPRAITLRRLLTHCSGLGYGKEFNLPPESAAEKAYHRLVEEVEHGAVTSLEDFCARLAVLPLIHEPGAVFSYSYGLDVIGRVIEVVSGKSLDAFLQEELFEPLGMVDTGFSVPKAKLGRLAGLYGSRSTAETLGQVLREDEADEAAWALHRLDGEVPEQSAWVEGKQCPVLSGGGIMGHNRGGLVGTMNDIARFCLMLVNNGRLPDGRQLLKEATVKDMVSQDWLELPECLGKRQRNAGTPGVTAAGDYGWNALGELGVVAEPRGKNDFELGEYGYGGIAETFFSINPARELVTVWFTQQVDNFSWSTPTANLWLAARKAVKKAGAPPRTAEAAEARSRSRQAPRRRLRGKSCMTPR
eukprot:TRINITY_DN40320_c0_g1_i1.p1 TRINITY_DN40320_c0_g1~~TRINITY_DN40320_c0_g1_i1.p1  ORF type:complete len:495 (-),score=107.73 TRINITY_DN40320_c0_g1_i1:30-1514(-)